MTSLIRPDTSVHHRPPARDAAVDLVRAASVLVVVALHVLVCCVSVSTDALTAGGVQISTAVEDEAWFAAASWVLQVLPLLFVLGGFASAKQWGRMRERTPARYAASRVTALLAPALPMIGAVAVGLGLAGLAGFDAQLLADAGYWIGRPLWFLAVYLGTASLVPLMLRLHRAAPARTLATLVVGAVLVDLARVVTGIDAIGAANLAFVWLALQQLGFWLADGAIDRVPRRAAWLTIVAAAVVLGALVAAGCSPEMLLANNNPPTSLLIVLGVAHLAAFWLARRQLERVAARPRVAAGVGWMSARSMHVYLWHVPALAAVIAIALAFGLPLPETGSLDWWLSRPVLLVATLGVLVTTLTVWPPKHGSRVASASPRAATAAVALAILVPLIALTASFTPLAAAAALLVGLASLRIVARSR